MRIGYGAFPDGIVEFLWRAKQPYNVSVAAEVAACAALSNPKYLEVFPVSKLLFLKQLLHSSSHIILWTESQGLDRV